MRFLLSVFAFAAMALSAQASPVLDIQKIVTPKGLEVWFVQDKHLPMLALQFSVRGGAQFDSKGKEGTAEILSTLLDEGAGKRNAESFQSDLDTYGIRIGFSSGRDAFSGSLKTTTQFKDMALGMMADALNAPHFDKDAIERMRQALLSNRRFAEMNPNWLAGDALFRAMYPDHSYGRAPDGTVASLQAITRNDIVAIKGKLFCRDRLNIALVGDLNKDEAATSVDQLFGTWPTCKDNIETAVTPPKQGIKQHIERDGAQTVLLIAQPGPARQDKDWWAARILDFTLGGGQFSSRLMDELRVKRGFTYGISSSLTTYDLSPLWMISAGVDPAHIDEAITLVKKTWDDVAANGLTVDEIAEAKSYMIGALPLAMTTSDQIASILLQLQEDGLPIDTLDHREAEINAVTMGDIKRVASEKLHRKQFSLITVGPKTQVKK